MARRLHRYPQVEPGARALIDTPACALPAHATASRALELARKRDARAVVGADDDVVLRDDLARALDLGLPELPATELARPIPIVSPSAAEATVRRHLAGGAPLVLVRERGTVLGAVSPAGIALPPGPSMAHRVERDVPEPVRTLVATITRLAARHGGRAFLVGGVVRDLVVGRAVEPSDLDVVVEGDAPALAQALAEELRAPVVVHGRFLTASVDVPNLGVVDVITSRSERYDVRGALPRVMPAGIRQDLRRRDLTVNAMAIELGTGSFELVDPFGGRVDIARRRLRILHPLSFVEDPTRIFRAARYAARLGFRLDRWTASAERRALDLVPYPALSGPRLLGEIERTLAEPDPGAVLKSLGQAGAFRLLDPRYRFTRTTHARTGELRAALAWARAVGLDDVPMGLTIVCLLRDQSPEVRPSALGRLGFSGEPLARLARALDETAAVLATLEGAMAASARARVLRGRDATQLAWLWLDGTGTVRTVLDWFVRDGRAVSAELRGDEVVKLGVARGPAVARVLEDLRDARLDGAIDDRAAETRYVRHWLEPRMEE